MTGDPFVFRDGIPDDDDDDDFEFDFDKLEGKCPGCGLHHAGECF